MPLPYRPFLLLTLSLMCVGNFGVRGQSTVDATAISTDPPSVDQPQTIDNFPTPTPAVTYPPTPVRFPVNPSTPVSPLPSTALTSIQVSPFLVAKTTPFFPAATIRGSPPVVSMTTNVMPPTVAKTTIPFVTFSSSVPQHCQLTFSNKLATDHDLSAQRNSAQNQLAELCGIRIDRITNIGINYNPSGNLVLRFTIEQGWPVYTADALQNLENKLNTTYLQLSGQLFLSPVAIYWTDNGPCPNEICQNNGTCNVTLSGDYVCFCDVSHTGPRCQDNVQMPTVARTTIPFVTPPSSVPQRCQLTFHNKLNDLKVTDYDLWTQRTSAQNQLAELCGIRIDRITNIALKPNPSGNLVLSFTIEQGWPVYTADALQNLKNQLNTTTTYLQLSGQPLLSPVAIYWTDNGPCPNETCRNNGTCDVTLSNAYVCLCDVSRTGPRCEDAVYAASSTDNRLLALLVLLIIPIAIAVILGFILGRRRREKEQLKKAFDLRDVRTIGPRSMLSLPTGGETVGIRNQMYDTRSFAIAFSDTTFSKSSPPPSSATSNNDDSASIGGEF